MPTEITVANEALRIIGEQRIDDLDEPHKIARELRSAFEPASQCCLEDYNWNFAQVRRYLAPLDTSPAFDWTMIYDKPAPLFGWRYLYAKPADWLKTVIIQDGSGYQPPTPLIPAKPAIPANPLAIPPTLEIPAVPEIPATPGNGDCYRDDAYPVEASDEGGAIAANYDGLFIKYVSRNWVNRRIGDWSQLYADYVASEIAVRIALTVTQSQSTVEMAAKVRRDNRLKAIAHDTQNQPPKRLPEGRWLKARRGSRHAYYGGE